MFEKDAIDFIAKHAAGIGIGDIRKAFSLCRATAEGVLKAADTLNDDTGVRKISIVDVRNAKDDILKSSCISTFISFSSTFEALLLVSLASLTYTKEWPYKSEAFDIQQLIVKMDSISGGSGNPIYSPPPNFGETLELLNRSHQNSFISLFTPKSSKNKFHASRGGSGGAWPMISLLMDPKTVRKSFRGTPHSDIAEKYIKPT